MNKEQILEEFFGEEEEALDEAAKKGRLPGTDPKAYVDRQRRGRGHKSIARSQAAIRANRANRQGRKRSIKAFWRSAEGQRMKTHLRRRMKESEGELDFFDMCDTLLEGFARLFNDEDAIKETYLVEEGIPETLLDAAVALDTITEFAWYMHQTDEEDEEDLYESIFEEEEEEEEDKDDSYFLSTDEEDSEEDADDAVDEKRMTAKEKKDQRDYRRSATGKRAAKRYKIKTSRGGYRPDPKRSRSSKIGARSRR